MSIIKAPLIAKYLFLVTCLSLLIGLLLLLSFMLFRFFSTTNSAWAPLIVARPVVHLSSSFHLFAVSAFLFVFANSCLPNSNWSSLSWRPPAYQLLACFLSNIFYLSFYSINTLTHTSIDNNTTAASELSDSNSELTTIKNGHCLSVCTDTKVLLQIQTTHTSSLKYVCVWCI